MAANIFTDYYLGVKHADRKCRYDITKSTQSYPLFEQILINKAKFNVGGLSFNYGQTPSHYKADRQRLTDMAITRGSNNISSVFVPNINKIYIGYGDVHTTTDAIIILFDEGKSTIEIFIARGYLYDKRNLYEEVASGYLDAELEAIRQKAVNVFKG
jgi:hypothetical protein